MASTYLYKLANLFWFNIFCLLVTALPSSTCLGGCERFLHPFDGKSKPAWGIAIPGLSMNARELPEIPGLVRVDNPGVGEGMKIKGPYTLEDIAEIHVRTVNEISPSVDEPFYVIGMSMGGMITSIMASKFRSQLPRNTQFLILATSPNLSENPAVPDSLKANWLSVRPGNEADFTRILTPFFSVGYREAHPEMVAEYVLYRTRGENQQTGKEFLKQLEAIRAFRGGEYFPQIDPYEVEIIGSKDDYVLGHTHNEDLRRLIPDARHEEIEDVGHMMNLEYPIIFSPRSRKEEQ